MFKTAISLFTLVIGLSCFAKSGHVKITGTVQNKTVNTIAIRFLDNQEVVSSELDSNGNFTLSTKIEDGYYSLQYGRNTTYIYLYPKDEFTIHFDAKHFNETLEFKGKGANRNNYLVTKSVKEAEFTEDLEAFYKVDEKTYLKNIEQLKASHQSLLADYNVENYFFEAEEKSLEYDRLLSIQNYASSYKFYLGDEIIPSKKFYKPIEKVNLNNQTEYKKQPYYRYLVNSVWSKRIEAEPNVDGMLRVLRKVPFRDLAISLINGFYSKISSNKDRASDYLKLIKRVTSHQPFIEAAEKQHEEIMNSSGLKKGDNSPKFSYESVNGETIALEDFKGKYVYIDVWATWCGPCIKQVPYLKVLEERYHNKNIAFVSISVDKEDVKNTWRQMIKDKELGGVQLFADKSFDSDFMNAYAINSIPRFILIDPEGKIIDPEAPRPSFEKTKELLDSLLQ